jgi:hypothetical protein
MGSRRLLIALVTGLAVSYYFVTRTTIGTNKVALFMLAMWFVGLFCLDAAIKKYGRKQSKTNNEQSNTYKAP